MPKKNDNIVGQSEGPIVNGGHQTPQQAEIVRQDGGGLSDAERRTMESGPEGKGNPSVGGSFGGHSDQMASQGPNEDRKVAGGLYDTERTKGTGDRSVKRKHRPS